MQAPLDFVVMLLGAFAITASAIWGKRRYQTGGVRRPLGMWMLAGGNILVAGAVYLLIRPSFWNPPPHGWSPQAVVWAPYVAALLMATCVSALAVLAGLRYARIVLLALLAALTALSLSGLVGFLKFFLAEIYPVESRWSVSWLVFATLIESRWFIWLGVNAWYLHRHPIYMAVGSQASHSDA